MAPAKPAAVTASRERVRRERSLAVDGRLRDDDCSTPRIASLASIDDGSLLLNIPKTMTGSGPSSKDD